MIREQNLYKDIDKVEEMTALNKNINMTSHIIPPVFPSASTINSMQSQQTNFDDTMSMISTNNSIIKPISTYNKHKTDKLLKIPPKKDNLNAKVIVKLASKVKNLENMMEDMRSSYYASKIYLFDIFVAFFHLF